MRRSRTEAAADSPPDYDGTGTRTHTLDQKRSSAAAVAEMGLLFER